jgi:abequosyltransferase
MASEIELSICIPTYNRSKYLNELLVCIESQIDEYNINSFQVCISDNASTDNTEDMVSRWIDESKLHIVYSKCKKNNGADKNYLRVVSLSAGKYCWLFGSDDLIRNGAINEMIDSIKSGRGIYLCNRIKCDINMNQLREQRWLIDDVETRDFNFSISKDLSDYFRSSTSNGALFSYLTSIVFRRELWNSYEFDQKYIGTAYSHVYMLLSMVKGGCDLNYIRNTLVLTRGGNDSFASEGVAARILLDLKGYSMLADDFFFGGEYYDIFLDVLRKKERPVFKTVISLRCYASDEEWRDAKSILRKLQYPSLFVSLVSHLKPLLLMMLRLRRKLV